MKKILLLTLHSQNNNFGSVLQAHSLYKYIESLGYNVTVLNYRPFYSNGATSLKELFIKIAVNTVFLPYLLVRTIRFNKIINQSKLTKLAKKYDDLKSISSDYDIFMIGSDQVWNPYYLCGQDDAYFLKFTDSSNKFSYAASLGTSDISSEALDNIVEKVKDFKYLSIREEVSSLQLREHGRVDTKYVLDPVFLYDENYYRNLVKKSNHIKAKGYILAYIIHKDEFISEIVDEFAKLLGKPVVQVGGFASKCNYDKFPRSAGPAEFLSLVDNADFVVTSSFHGTAFSHIFHKQFAVVMPYSNNLRIENILNTAGTSNRVVKSVDDVKNMLEQIDYNVVNPNIEMMRKESSEFLANVLDEMGD